MSRPVSALFHLCCHVWLVLSCNRFLIVDIGTRLHTVGAWTSVAASFASASAFSFLVFPVCARTQCQLISTLRLMRWVMSLTSLTSSVGLALLSACRPTVRYDGAFLVGIYILLNERECLPYCHELPLQCTALCAESDFFVIQLSVLCIYDKCRADAIVYFGRVCVAAVMARFFVTNGVFDCVRVCRMLICV